MPTSFTLELILVSWPSLLQEQIFRRVNERSGRSIHYRPWTKLLRAQGSSQFLGPQTKQSPGEIPCLSALCLSNRTLNIRSKNVTIFHQTHMALLKGHFRTPSPSWFMVPHHALSCDCSSPMMALTQCFLASHKL